MTTLRRIGFVLIPDFPLMSYASAVEPLRAANVLAGEALYEWRVLTIDGAPARASVGVEVVADADWIDAKNFDQIFVCAGGNPASFDHRPTFGRLRACASAGVAIGGMSGGAFLLARAGLLAKQRCTIHWEHIPALSEEFPDLLLERSLFVFDGDRATCAGGLAAFDMMVELIRRRHGEALALAVSEWFLRTRAREGAEDQRISLRERARVANPRVLKILGLMEERIEAPFSHQELARQAGVSLRQLERLFSSHLGRTLGEAYVDVRLERARKLLRESSLSVMEIALACGFVSASHFARRYKQRFGEAPRASRLTEM